MTELFTEKDFTDSGGYNLQARYILDKVNERVARLVKERDEARDLCKLAGQTMATHAALINGCVKEWEKK